MGYDYTVFAGTQGVTNHKKKDRPLSLADKWSMPVILFAEGGGGRPGDEWPTPAGLETTTFTRFWRAQRQGAGHWNGLRPLFPAGNAALLGGCDVIIADKTSNIGMGGPAMIEGGGLRCVPSRRISDRSRCRYQAASSMCWSRTRPKRMSR